MCNTSMIIESLVRCVCWCWALPSTLLRNYKFIKPISHGTSILFGSVSAVMLFQEVHVVVYLLADAKRHWFMSAEVSSWWFQVRKLRI